MDALDQEMLVPLYHVTQCPLYKVHETALAGVPYRHVFCLSYYIKDGSGYPTCNTQAFVSARGDDPL